ncbi:aldo/keto reductase [Aureimonas pseudogalii]|uniref:D-threo-aldose 1-dehydrogenase n=1 Tax=Aureimonas pseudogalii TaxID=1744844 RepID=A0A7W6EE33_9HYPH|nr:aldo/keto reductase [Aureimonas pseudogalii]MBB3997632.1 D-threo-aldose 1-dehydrogenase [Aureimonas pseudogalii]
MKASDTRRLKRAAIDLTLLGMGTAPLGGLYTPVAIEDARAAMRAAWDAGIRHFDTAPMYGLGRCEHLTGELLREEDPSSFAVSTKVGRLMSFERPGRTLPPEPPKNEFDSGWNNGLSFREVFDYSYDGVMRSVDDSRQRTGISKLDILFVHDIGRVTHGALHDQHWGALTTGGGFRALEELKAAGLIAGFGLGVNEWQVISDAMEETDLDVCLLAGRYTLLDDDAAKTFLPKALAREVDLVIGGVFNSGILASSSGRKKFNYVDAPAEIVARVERLEAACRAFEVPLAAAAIQYPLRHPAATNVVIGAKNAAQVTQNVAWFEQTIPPELWNALEEGGLIPAL